MCLQVKTWVAVSAKIKLTMPAKRDVPACIKPIMCQMIATGAYEESAFHLDLRQSGAAVQTMTATWGFTLIKCAILGLCKDLQSCISCRVDTVIWAALALYVKCRTDEFLMTFCYKLQAVDYLD